jgi:ribosomal protein S18 acetylase RimI-like enzyme
VATTIDFNRLPIRKLDVRRDLLSVAELIELCFYTQMDVEGREYVRQIRQAGVDTRYQRWMPGAGERISFPLYGFVWEENGRVIGNLSLIPFFRTGKWYYLIANVAVHPDHRRRGIARNLTQKALDHARQHNVDSAWLQVRDDNLSAEELYRAQGFVERARRSTWINNYLRFLPLSNNPFIHVRPRRGHDWQQQMQWLSSIYPPEIIWNLGLNISGLGPGLWPSLMRLLNGEMQSHWSALENNRLIGGATWQMSMQGTDNIWLGVSPAKEEQALAALLPHLINSLPNRRSVQINYPDRRGNEVFSRCGFTLHNTLIWMEKRFKN